MTLHPMRPAVVTILRITDRSSHTLPIDSKCSSACAASIALWRLSRWALGHRRPNERLLALESALDLPAPSHVMSAFRRSMNCHPVHFQRSGSMVASWNLDSQRRRNSSANSEARRRTAQTRAIRRTTRLPNLHRRKNCGDFSTTTFPKYMMYSSASSHCRRVAGVRRKLQQVHPCQRSAEKQKVSSSGTFCD